MNKTVLLSRLSWSIDFLIDWSVKLRVLLITLSVNHYGKKTNKRCNNKTFLKATLLFEAASEEVNVGSIKKSENKQDVSFNCFAADLCFLYLFEPPWRLV